MCLFVEKHIIIFFELVSCIDIELEFYESYLWSCLILSYSVIGYYE